ncbi:uncharacterized protein LOC117647931 [Thrips palmi]|uniref:Uncharacterized protein LOC117647931 n=1 Tax=Thrips palmi TaxID=161013 RepID=A0A6P8ZC20_THRPL|nr:uncharacterized protein LOC117647931 [Thrips palmi]XP_034245809.1 uncharacterized protein LOC117647931 [Thrips palmi]
MEVSLDKPFAILKFPPAEDEESMEVGLASWLVGGAECLSDEMDGMTFWPESKNVTNYVKTQHPHDPLWKTYPVKVLRFYETYVKAREALPKFIADSNYDTEVECSLPKGRGKRIRFKPAFLESSDEDEIVPVKKSRQSVPPPPPISTTTKVRKGQGSAEDVKKKAREDVMARLKAARAAAAAKMAQSARLSPLKAVARISPAKSPIKANNWEVTEMQVKAQAQVHVDATAPISPLNVASSTRSVGSDILATPTQMSVGLVTPNSRSGPASDFSSLFDNGEMLDVSMDEEDPEAILTDTPVTPLKSPSPKRDQRSLLERTKSFYISPLSFERQTSLTERGNLVTPTRGTSSPLKSVHRNRTSPKSKLAGTSSAGGGLSKLDGRINLFPQGMNADDRLKALQVSVSRLNIDVHETSQKIDLILMNLSRLQRALVPNENRLTMPANMPKLPLEDRTQLNHFETFLGENDLNLAAVCDYMSNYIKTSVTEPERKSATNILSKLLTNDLAKEMNLEGGNKKIAFRSLNLYKVFQGTLQTAFPDSDLITAEQALKNWLKDAKWRKQRVPDAA